jgi:hypothetical protein
VSETPPEPPDAGSEAKFRQMILRNPRLTSTRPARRTTERWTTRRRHRRSHLRRNTRLLALLHRGELSLGPLPRPPDVLANEVDPAGQDEKIALRALRHALHRNAPLPGGPA